MSTFADRKAAARRRGFTKWFCTVVAIHPYLGVAFAWLMLPLVILVGASIGAASGAAESLGDLRSSIRDMLSIARQD